MEPASYRRQMLALQGQARFFRLVSILLAAGVACMAGAMFAIAQKDQRVVIVPPEVRSSYWVEDAAVSRSYYLEWGHYVVSLLLNVSPESIDYQSEILLRHVAPGSAERMRARLAAAAEKLRRESLTTFFAVSGVEVRQQEGQVAFAGSLTSYVQGRRIGERRAAFAASFKVVRGQLALVELVETDPDNIFAPKEA